MTEPRRQPRGRRGADWSVLCGGEASPRALRRPRGVGAIRNPERTGARSAGLLPRSWSAAPSPTPGSSPFPRIDRSASSSPTRRGAQPARAKLVEPRNAREAAQMDLALGALIQEAHSCPKRGKGAPPAFAVTQHPVARLLTEKAVLSWTRGKELGSRLRMQPNTQRGRISSPKASRRRSNVPPRWRPPLGSGAGPIPCQPVGLKTRSRGARVHGHRRTQPHRRP